MSTPLPLPRENAVLLGHQAAESAVLRAFASGRFPHAWLIEGSEGLGKATLAFRIARFLLNRDRDPAEGLAMDPAHPVFRQVAIGSHPDLTVLERPQAERRSKTEIPVDAVRSAIEALRVSSLGGGWRVLVVDPAEALNRNAVNALLKLLEEPPARSTLLLVSHGIRDMPPTVRSRCARLRLRAPRPEKATQDLIQLRPTLGPERASALVDFAHQCLGRALKLDGSDEVERYEHLLRTLAGRPEDAALLRAADGLAAVAGTDGLGRVHALVLETLARVARQALGRPPAPVFPDEPALLARLAPTPLDRLATVWDKAGRLIRAADAVNLDPVQAIRGALGELASLRSV